MQKHKHRWECIHVESQFILSVPMLGYVSGYCKYRFDFAYVFHDLMYLVTEFRYAHSLPILNITHSIMSSCTEEMLSCQLMLSLCIRGNFSLFPSLWPLRRLLNSSKLQNSGVVKKKKFPKTHINQLTWGCPCWFQYMLLNNSIYIFSRSYFICVWMKSLKVKENPLRTCKKYREQGWY